VRAVTQLVGPLLRFAEVPLAASEQLVAHHLRAQRLGDVLRDVLGNDYLLALLRFEEELKYLLRREMAEFWHLVRDPLANQPHEDGVEDVVHLLEAEVESVELDGHVVLGVALLELAHAELGFLFGREVLPRW
jgi:hypothetical protein